MLAPKAIVAHASIVHAWIVKSVNCFKGDVLIPLYNKRGPLHVALEVRAHHYFTVTNY